MYVDSIILYENMPWTLDLLRKEDNVNFKSHRILRCDFFFSICYFQGHNSIKLMDYYSRL